jgi:hypothetical protein
MVADKFLGVFIKKSGMRRIGLDDPVMGINHGNTERRILHQRFEGFIRFSFFFHLFLHASPQVPSRKLPAETSIRQNGNATHFS